MNALRCASRTRLWSTSLLKPVVRHPETCPSVWHGTLNGRLYTTQNTTSPSPPITPKQPPPAPKPKPVVPPPPVKRPETRHEVHEGTAALNVPYNPPGGGPGPNIPGGGGQNTVTGSPLLDALLTTAVGLGAGE